jgi:putative transport protein
VAGKTVAEAEKSVTGARLFVERIRRKGDIFAPSGTTILEPGDQIAVVGRTEALVKVLGQTSSEVADPELLEIPVASYDIYVTQKAIVGKTLRELADNIDETRGVLLRGVLRGEQLLPIGTELVIQRGDTLQVTGSETAVEKLAPVIGRILHPVEESDLATLGIAVAVGILLGAVIAVPVGGVKITLGTSVGTLLAALVVGYIRSVRPWFGGMPDAAILFMRSIGLAAFVAMIGLKAGPIFVQAVKQSGYLLFLGGIVVTMIPLITGLLFGRYVLKLNPLLLLGGVAGAQTMIAGVAAVQEKSDSPIATLGYSYTVAIGHILLTTWGSVIVALLSS